jgi:hypothetical protein
MKATHMTSQNGQSLIIIALMMVGILGFLGLVLDGGQAFLTRRNSQDAADAAAFAAVRVLATKPDSSSATEQAIYTTALDYARANQVITNTDVTVAFLDQTNTQIRTINPAIFVGVPTNPLATGVLVTATIRLQPYFIDLLIGNNPVPIPSVAAAQSGPPRGVGQLMPMTVNYPTSCTYPPTPSNPCFTYGMTVTLQGGNYGAGAFQWLTYSNPCDSSNWGIQPYLTIPPANSGVVYADPSNQYYVPGNDVQNQIYSHNSPSSSSWICNGPGFKSSQPIATQLDNWLALPPSQRLWLIPVTNGQDGATGSNTYYHVVMFAQFQFLGYDFGGKSGGDTTLLQQQKMNGVEGKFLQYAGPMIIKPGVCNTNGLDACGYSLSQ